MVSVAITRVRQGHAPFAGLVWTLIRTDFKTRYHGTIGGFVWALLKPLTMFLVLLAVFSYVFATDPQYKFDLIIGLFLYEFFQESTKAGLLSRPSTRGRCIGARAGGYKHIATVAG